MCRSCDAASQELSRRTVVRSAGVGFALHAGGSGPAVTAPFTRPGINTRAQWAGRSSPVQGPLSYEADGDVRCLLVHHSETTNGYQRGDVPRIIRSFYRTHTDKGWPDIAYNFLVDRYGGIWEGRANSLRSPTIPSATGGSQGFAQIACWIGNHRTIPPTPAAQRSMIALLSWLSFEYDIATRVGATVQFRSRGSGRWRKGALVSTRTIEGHRFMSLTDCPGDAAYTVARGLQEGVTRHRAR